jgi:hypothetical protein
VREEGQNQTYGYELSFIKVQCGTNRVESGDGGETIKPGQLTGGRIETRVDIDSYCFSALSNDLITIDIYRTNGNGSPHFRLYDQNGEFVISDNWIDNALGFREDVRLPSTGTYTLIVREEGQDQTYDYELSFIKVQCGTNMIEAGDGGEAIEPSQLTGGRIETRVDIDSYCFSALANELVTINLYRTNGTGSPSFRLYDQSGQWVVTSGDAGGALDFREDIRLPSDGMYTLIVREDGQDQTNDYALSFIRVPATAPFLEPGQSRSNNIALGDLDAFSIHAIAGDTITIKIERTSGLGQPYMRLYSPASSFLLAGTETIHVPCVTETGFYTVSVRDAGANQTVGYELSLTQYPIVPSSSGLTQYLAVLRCSTNVIVRWSTDALGFHLQRADELLSLESLIVWSNILPPYASFAGYYYVTNQSPAVSGFFRLTRGDVTP